MLMKTKNTSMLYTHIYTMDIFFSFSVHSIIYYTETNSLNVTSLLLISSFPGLYGVGKAAVHPPALAILSHKPEGASKTIAWVGKGIVYDTGGLSIKGKVGSTKSW